ncbi:hypothetical protein SFRURICE_004562 [Spodoptera frugiperda]|nr:hypothetical protein SFRURICE_004562 [Spodoptera frugiperda]
MGRRRWRLVTITAFLLFVTKDTKCQEPSDHYRWGPVGLMPDPELRTTCGAGSRTGWFLVSKSLILLPLASLKAGEVIG